MEGGNKETGIGLACSFWKKGENTRQKTLSFVFLFLLFSPYKNINVRRKKSRRITNKKVTNRYCRSL